MVEVFTKEEIEKEQRKALKNLVRRDIRSQAKLEYTSTKNPRLAKETQQLSRFKKQEAIKNIQRQNLKNSNLYRTASATSGVATRFERTSGREVRSRSAAVKRLLGAVGASGQSQSGPGRPRGTYKYGAPIQQIKRMQSQRRAMAQLQAQKLQIELTKKGYSPEQIQQILSQQQFEASPEEYQQLVAEANVSPHTQMMLEEIRRIQNKGKADDDNMQRVLRERKMVNQAMNLMNTPNIFKAIPGQMEGWLERPETNPLRAPNIFAEDRTRNPSIMDTQGRPTILQSVQRLNFFGDPLNTQQANKPVSNKLNFWKA